MLVNAVGLIIAYLAFGLLTSFLARKGRSEDWEETILASVLGPPLFTLIAAAVIARFFWVRLPLISAGSQPRAPLW